MLLLENNLRRLIRESSNSNKIDLSTLPAPFSNKDNDSNYIFSSFKDDFFKYRSPSPPQSTSGSSSPMPHISNKQHYKDVLNLLACNSNDIIFTNTKKWPDLSHWISYFYDLPDIQNITTLDGQMGFAGTYKHHNINYKFLIFDEEITEISVCVRNVDDNIINSWELKGLRELRGLFVGTSISAIPDYTDIGGKYSIANKEIWNLWNKFVSTSRDRLPHNNISMSSFVNRFNKLAEQDKNLDIIVDLKKTLVRVAAGEVMHKTQPPPRNPLHMHKQYDDIQHISEEPMTLENYLYHYVNPMMTQDRRMNTLGEAKVRKMIRKIIKKHYL